jgi:hypothetical protein
MFMGAGFSSKVGSQGTPLPEWTALRTAFGSAPPPSTPQPCEQVLKDMPPAALPIPENVHVGQEIAFSISRPETPDCPGADPTKNRPPGAHLPMISRKTPMLANRFHRALVRHLMLSTAMATATPCFASQARESLEAVVSRTEAAIVVDIMGAREVADATPYSRVLDLDAKPVSLLIGVPFAERMLHCEYSEGLPHERGGVQVWPLISGSGMEYGINEGDRVILLVGRLDSGSDTCRVLRIERLEMSDDIASQRLKHG